MIVIVDYGMGNLRSVEKALVHAGGEVRVSAKASDIDKAEVIVLPGVGSFDHAIQELKERSLFEPLMRSVRSGKPTLGLCLGLQLLFEESEEGFERGLGLVRGKVKKFDTARLKIPHMGWNQVQPLRPSPLWAGMGKDPYFYFVHSYYVEPEDEGVGLALSSYGREFTSAVQYENIVATQFHPEKSQENGLRFLKNVLDLFGRRS